VCVASLLCSCNFGWPFGPCELAEEVENKKKFQDDVFVASKNDVCSTNDPKQLVGRETI